MAYTLCPMRLVTHTLSNGVRDTHADILRLLRLAPPVPGQWPALDGWDFAMLDPPSCRYGEGSIWTPRLIICLSSRSLITSVVLRFAAFCRRYCGVQVIVDVGGAGASCKILISVVPSSCKGADVSGNILIRATSAL